MNASLRTLTLALLAAAPLVAAADDLLRGPHHPDVVSSERGFETSTAYTLLPSSVPGTLTVNMCMDCKSSTLSVNASTRFFVGTQQLAFADFKSRVAGAPSTPMMVFAALQEPVATRVVLYAPRPASQTRTR